MEDTDYWLSFQVDSKIYLDFTSKALQLQTADSDDIITADSDGIVAIEGASGDGGIYVTYLEWNTTHIYIAYCMQEDAGEFYLGFNFISFN